MTADFPIPAGYALVPLEPTLAMIEAAKDERMACFKDTSLSVGAVLTRIYTAALAAAPPIAAVVGEPMPTCTYKCEAFPECGCVPEHAQKAIYALNHVLDCLLRDCPDEIQASTLESAVAGLYVIPEVVGEPMREFLGKLVRAEWMAWAVEQPIAKASWLTPWDELTEPEREVDRRIGERVWKFACVGATPPLATDPAAGVGVEASRDHLGTQIAKAEFAKRWDEAAQRKCDEAVTPEFLRWLQDEAYREGVAANVAWNAGVAWARAQALPVAAGEAVAHVPIHPRNGPLWMDTLPAGSQMHRSASYPMMPLYAGSPPTAREPLSEDEISDIVDVLEQAPTSLAHAKHDDIVALVRAVEEFQSVRGIVAAPTGGAE